MDAQITGSTMTATDKQRALILTGWVCARLSSGDWKLALFDTAVGIGLLAIAHWIDESWFSPLKN
jgi:hypothetical protein